MDSRKVKASLRATSISNGIVLIPKLGRQPPHPRHGQWPISVSVLRHACLKPFSLAKPNERRAHPSTAVLVHSRTSSGTAAQPCVPSASSFFTPQTNRRLRVPTAPGSNRKHLRSAGPQETGSSNKLLNIGSETGGSQCGGQIKHCCDAGITQGDERAW